MHPLWRIILFPVLQILRLDRRRFCEVRLAKTGTFWPPPTLGVSDFSSCPRSRRGAKQLIIYIFVYFNRIFSFSVCRYRVHDESVCIRNFDVLARTQVLSVWLLTVRIGCSIFRVSYTTFDLRTHPTSAFPGSRLPSWLWTIPEGLNTGFSLVLQMRPEDRGWPSSQIRTFSYL